MNLPLFALDIDDRPDGEGFVFALGLVDQPATERMWRVFEQVKAYRMSVSNEEQRILAGPLMVADQPIYRRDPDGREYYVSFPAKSIAKIVNKYTRSKEALAFNLDHDDSLGIRSAHLQQHFIINKAMGLGTPEGFAELPDGSWFGFVKIEDEAEWEEAKKRGGFSVEGYFNEVKIMDAEQALYENLKNHLNKMQDNKQGLKKFWDLFKLHKEKLEDIVPPVTATTKLADGTGSIEGTIAQGSPVMLVTMDGSKGPAPDGEYMLEGGAKITVMGGMIASLEEQQEPLGPEVMTEEKVLEAIQKALSAQQEKFDARIKELEEKHTAETKATAEKFKSTLDLMELLAGTEKPLPVAQDPKRESVVKFNGNMKSFFKSLGNMKEN